MELPDTLSRVLFTCTTPELEGLECRSMLAVSEGQHAKQKEGSANSAAHNAVRVARDQERCSCCFSAILALKKTVCRLLKQTTKTAPQTNRDTGLPFEQVGSDIFEFKGRHYVVLIDYTQNSSK